MKMLEETGTKVSIPTVKRVQYRRNLKGRSARKKPPLQYRHEKARLWFATAHGDKDRTFWRNVLWSDETKIEVFGHNDHRYVWRKTGEACKPKNTIPTMRHRDGSIVLLGCFAAGGTGALHKIDGIMRQEKYVDTLKQHQDISQEGQSWVFQMGQCPQVYFQMWQNGLRTTKSRYWSGHHKALTSII